MADNLELKTYAGEIECKEAGGKLIVRGWASAPVVDRSKEYIDGRAFDLSEYKGNPVYLWCHDRKGMPLGLADVSVQKWQAEAYGLMADFDHNPNNEFAVKVYESYKGGYMRGFSVGFKPLAQERMRPDQLNRLGFDSRDEVMNFTACKLYEISAVPIPDNQSALSVAVVKELMGAMPADMREKVLAMVPARHTFVMGVKFPTWGAELTNSIEVKTMADQIADKQAVAVEVKEVAAVAVPAVEKAVEVPVAVQDSPVVASAEVVKEASADAKPDDGKHGPKAFRHVVDSCVKACGEASEMSAKSDHPKAGATMKKCVKKILKGCHHTASKGAGMWDSEEDKSFGDAASKIKEMMGEDEPDDDEGSEGEGDKPKKGEDDDMKEIVLPLTEAVTGLAEKSGELEAVIEELKAENKSLSAKLDGMEKALGDGLKAIASAVGLQI